MFNKNDYEQLVQEGVRDISKLNCPELLNNKYTVSVVNSNSRFNAIIRHIGSTNLYNIEVNSKLNKCDYNEIKNTIYHEVLHSINGGNGHAGRWKYKAIEVNKKYGLNIKRTNSYNAVAQQRKIQVLCSECGKMYGYSRLGKNVADIEAHPLNHGCGHCGKWGTLKIIKK